MRDADGARAGGAVAEGLGKRYRPYRPVSWAHHPPEIKAALRSYRIRPVSKSCHMNSQRFCLCAHELKDRLTYREGLARCPLLDSFWFAHAWLTFDGEVLDFTLEPQLTLYGESWDVPRAELVEVHGRRDFYGFVHEARIWEAEARHNSELIKRYA